VYVTHDQIEAMTTADRIVVMNQGRIEQEGAPDEIYQAPNSEFVARFIGGTNILKGRNLSDNAVGCAGFTLSCRAGKLAPTGETAVSIRMHDIRLATELPQNRDNTAAGTVVRQIYLGATRDYLVELSPDIRVRVTTPMQINVAAGSRVWLYFPPEHCRALAH